MLTPLQLSARSQIPADARQTAVLLVSFGHAALDPVQVSATSQTPAAARHMVPAATKPSVGQVLLTPLQLSGTSQMPAEGRHTAVLLASFGHVELEPVHVSWTSQTPAAARQTVPAASIAHAEEQQSPLARLPSSHVSAASRTPLPQTAAWNVTMVAAQLRAGLIEPLAR